MQYNREPAIEFDNVSKHYPLAGPLAERKLIDVLGSAMADLRAALRTPRKFRTNGRGQFWALRDLSFQVAPGEIVGIVGNNGAGKSTLLKILARITEPTAGLVTYTGRVGSLLEVGTGFHPELSGRDNVFLSGAILGMHRREIVRRFDEIVAFAGLEQFIDTPVKRYSSGMYLRLGFAVSAHLDTEILLVDEILAVGDVSFQKKCLARMAEVARDGRTVLFVSHNLTAINALCKRTLVLEAGRLVGDGKTGEVLSAYLRNNIATDSITTISRWREEDAPASDVIRMISASLHPVGGTPSDPIYATTTFAIGWRYRNLIEGAILDVRLILHDQQGLLLFDTGSWDPPVALPAGTFQSSCIIPCNLLNDGDYSITLIFRDQGGVVLELPRVLQFEVVDSEDGRHGWFGKWDGILRPRFPWKTEALSDTDASDPFLCSTN